MWQPIQNENQTVLDAAMYTLDRDVEPLKGAAAGSWSLGIVEQFQGEDSRETDRGGVREEIMVGNACGGKLGSHGSKAVLLSHA